MLLLPYYFFSFLFVIVFSSYTPKEPKWYRYIDIMNLSINISTCRFECPIFEEIPLEITNIYDSFDEKSIFMLNSEKYDFDLFDNMFWWVYNMNMILICRTLLFHSNPKKSTTLIRSIKIIVLILVNVDF